MPQFQTENPPPFVVPTVVSSDMIEPPTVLVLMPLLAIGLIGAVPVESTSLLSMNSSPPIPEVSFIPFSSDSCLWSPSPQLEVTPPIAVMTKLDTSVPSDDVGSTPIIITPSGAVHDPNSGTRPMNPSVVSPDGSENKGELSMDTINHGLRIEEIRNLQSSKAPSFNRTMKSKIVNESHTDVLPNFYVDEDDVVSSSPSSPGILPQDE